MAESTTEAAIAEIWQLFKETDTKFKETDARLDQRFTETNAQLNQRFSETDRQIKETNAQLRRLEGLFGNQWGRLIEALVQPSVLKLFRNRGHDVHRLHQRSKAQRNGSSMEIDIILEDGNEVVPIEVKSTLTVEAVNEFLAELGEFIDYFPVYKSYRVYGAVAGLDVPQDVERYALRRGLFVLRVSGNEMVELVNDEKFVPRDFGKMS